MRILKKLFYVITALSFIVTGVFIGKIIGVFISIILLVLLEFLINKYWYKR
jgi:hypothetical protein